MRPTLFHAPALVVGIAALACLSGCQAKTSSVSGKVTYEGKPVAGGSVILYCQDKQIVRGIIGTEGNFTIPNVPLGTATATVHAHTQVPPGLQFKQKRIPPVIDGPIPPRIDPANAGAAALIPERFGVPEESGLNLTVDRPRLVFNIDLTP